VPVTRLNHAVLYVRDIATSVAFYAETLGFREVMSIPGTAAFLQASGSTNDHDLGLFQIGSQAGESGAGRSTVGLYHLAWEVDTLDELQRIAIVLAEAGAFVGATDHATTKALYAHDPDGLEFEVSWMVPADQLPEIPAELRKINSPLDIQREIARYGGQRRGGIGVSWPAHA
jgi:catechol-2,3-dioxygenase